MLKNTPKWLDRSDFHDEQKTYQIGTKHKTTNIRTQDTNYRSKNSLSF